MKSDIEREKETFFGFKLIHHIFLGNEAGMNFGKALAKWHVQRFKLVGNW